MEKRSKHDVLEKAIGFPVEKMKSKPEKSGVSDARGFYNGRNIADG
jgi:hypothetical protein